MISRYVSGIASNALSYSATVSSSHCRFFGVFLFLLGRGAKAF